MTQNYDDLATAIIQSLRGKRSQRQLSMKLGTSHNHVYKLESGSKRIKWREFVGVCSAVKYDISKIIASTVSFQGDLLDESKLYRHLALGYTHKQIATRLKRPEALIRRWSRSDQDLNLADVLQMIDKLGGSFALLLSSIPNLQLPDSFSNVARDLAEIKFTHDHPESSAVVYCLKLDSYRDLSEHKEGFIAKAIGISIESERKFIAALEAVGVIAKVGKKYVPERNYPLDFRTADRLYNQLASYWLERGKSQIDRGIEQRPKSITAYHVFPISQQGYEKIHNLCFSFYNQLVTIVNEDSHPSECIATMALMTFDASQ